MGAGSSSPVPAAEAALLLARAAAETTRAAADAAATERRAAADAAATATESAARAAALTADAAATATESAARAAALTADAASKTAASNAALVPLAIGLAVAVALAADFVACESPAFIRRRMLRTLRSCRLPPSVPVTRALLLPVAQAPLTLGFLPTMLLGPTGCGKSTLLDCLARDAAAGDATAGRAPAPVVLVKLRLPTSDESSRTAGAPVDAKVLMDSAAAQMYAQIGYPLRRSFVGAALARGFTLQGSFSQGELDASTTATSVRLVAALETLFSVCAELQRERVAAGLSEHDAAPVLIFDEMQDLIKDARLKSAGGELIFCALATLIVAFGVDRKVVRAVVAGSSAELDFSFNATTARGNRWNYYDLADPAPDVVAAALVARGYTEADACAMVARCGTRLRLLSRPLELGAAKVGAAVFLDGAAAAGREAFEKVIRQLNASSAADLARVLDAVAACDAGRAPSAPANEGARPALARPTVASLPAAARALDVASILYVDRSSRLHFQSVLHANAWAARAAEMA